MPGVTSTVRYRPSSCFPFLVLPQPESSEKCVGVVAEPGLRRQTLQPLGIAAADHDIVRLERRAEPGHDILDLPPPLLLPSLLQSPQPDIVFVGAPPVRQ